MFYVTVLYSRFINPVTSNNNLVDFLDYILYIITVSETLLQLHNRREDQSEERMENSPGIRGFSLVTQSRF